jgi:hypothetical protein
MLRDGLSSLLEKLRSQRGTGSSKSCTSRPFGMGEAVLVCLCTSGELESMEMFHPTPNQPPIPTSDECMLEVADDRMLVATA